MSSSSLPSPLTIPLKFRRKSSSASTSVSMDNHSLGDAAPSSSPPLSSPLLTPLHLMPRYGRRESRAGDYLDDLNEIICGPRDKIEDATRLGSCHTRLEHPLPLIHRPLPSLMTKFVAHTLRSDAPQSYSLSSFSSAPQKAYFFPQGDSGIADDCEEHDLESMDIHIRETYFATSAERGRWLSSPIASRSRPQAIPSVRGHSSPIKTLAGTSSPKERSRRHKRRSYCYSVDKQISTPPPEDRNEDLRCSSSLPPSSPLASPTSSFSFLRDDCDSIVDPRSKSDDCHSFTGTPELSNSSTTCTSPVEPTYTPTPHETPAVVPPLDPTDILCHLPTSVIPRHTSTCPGYSPKLIDVHVPSTTNFELDNIPSPLSQLEFGFLEAEPSKLPLADTVNRPYAGQHTATPVTVETARSQDGLSCMRSLSNGTRRETLDFSLATVGASSYNKRAKKGRKSATGSPRTRQTKKHKHVVIQPWSPSSMLNYSEPPNKKTKLSCRIDDSESRAAKSLLRRDGIPKAERPTSEGCDLESACSPHSKTSKPIGHTQPRQRTSDPPTIPVLTAAVDAEFHVSLTGMLIEVLATSRATSMDSVALYFVLTQAHPRLAAERSKEELLIDISSVLEAGRARCGMFEKVDSSGERSRHKALESRWFYVPERDEDRERASLISTIMPRQKRSETKKYKQYYYRPLDKISRWDAEDAP